MTDAPIRCRYLDCDAPARVTFSAYPYRTVVPSCPVHAPGFRSAWSARAGDHPTREVLVNLDPRRCSVCGRPEASCLRVQAVGRDATHAYVPAVPVDRRRVVE